TEIKDISTGDLGGVPGRIHLSQGQLWMTLPAKSRIAAVELADGKYQVATTVSTVDAAGHAILPADFLPIDGGMLVSSGEGGTVLLYRPQADGGYLPTGQLRLAYLIRNGNLFAGQMLLRGQTLYVAGGQGDLQLFDISAWLDGRDQADIGLKHYFSVTGATNAIAFGGQALYAGTSFVYVNSQPAENPLDVGARVQQLGGALDTIENDVLTITDQDPAARGYLPANAAVEIQFNRILDPTQVSQFGDTLLTVELNGAAVPGFVSSMINHDGTRLIFRPKDSFQDDKEYRVNISGALQDLNGNTLGNDYSFRFVAVAAASPIIDNLQPRYGSWRGGSTVTLTGSNFDTNTAVSIGGVAVPADDILEVRGDEIKFRLPPLRAPPADNLVVGLSVANGKLREFQAGAFTYVTDPAIQSVGLYDPTTGTFQAGNTRLQYNAGQYVAVTGSGFSYITHVSINDKPVSGATLVAPDMLVFQMPDQTVGPLKLAVSNLPDNSDAVINTDLYIELTSSKRVSKTGGSYRAGSLLMLTGTVNNDTAATIYTTQDGAAPVKLSSIDFGSDTVHAAALSSQYAIFSVGSDNQLWVYDLSNVYAPILINRIPNADGIPHIRLEISGNSFVSYASDAIRVGQLHGAGWQTFSLNTTDMAVENGYLYLLYVDHVEARDITAPGQVVASYNFTSAPTRFVASPQRLLLEGANDVEVLDTGGIPDGGGFVSLGDVPVPGLVEARLNGEIMAALTAPGGGSAKLSLYDVNRGNGGTGLVLESIATVRNDDGFSGANGFRYQGDLVEWLSGDNYYNSQVPVPNIVGIDPSDLITGSSQTVSLQVTGDPLAWKAVVATIQEDSSGHSLSGDTRLEGNLLQFRIINDAYQPDARYDVGLFNAPTAVIDGGQLTFDMPWQLSAAKLFGVAPISAQAMAPVAAITGQNTHFVVNGAQLQTVTGVTLNGAALASGSWTVNDDGTQLSFDAALPSAGIYGLTLTDGSQTSQLPAAVVATDALTISNVATDNPHGATLLSNTAGATTVSVSGTGFAGDISVHLLANGEAPNADNAVRYTLDGSGIHFAAPAGTPGFVYHVALVRTATNETVTSPVALAAVDDTPPVLSSEQALGYSAPLRLVFDEPVKAGGFSVTAQPEDYSGAGSSDVSAQFGLYVNDNTVEVRPNTLDTLQHNTIYHVAVTGITDLAGNVPLDAYNLASGVYSSGFVGTDTLAPKDLTLVRKIDGEAVSAAMLLTRSRSYTFGAAATDNMTADKNLSYKVRLSTDSGLTFGAPQSFNGNQFTYTVQGSDTGLVFDVTAYDAAGNATEARYEAAVADPTINVSTLYTVPARVEEIARADINFDLSGDVDLLSSAQMRVFDKWYDATLTPKSGGGVTATLSYLNPKLADIAPQTSVPVRLLLKYGATSKTVNGSYPLVLDATPPTVSIVSPADGDKIPLNQPTDVLIKAFDRYGIAHVDVQQNGGGFKPIADPTKYTFTPTTTDPVVIDVRAADPNGNVSTPVTVTLQPYLADGDAPELKLVAPDNGSTYHGGQDITFGVVMRNLASADLYFDNGGVASNTPVGTLKHAVSDPVRFTYTATLPDVAQDGVIVVRLEGGGLKSRLYLNVKHDAGVSETPTATLSPAKEILGGTELWIDAPKPSSMDDFSSTSHVDVKDPAGGSVTGTVAMDSGPHAVAISDAGDAVGVDEVLEDLSHHQKTVMQTLTKDSYFGAASTIYSATTPDDQVGHITSVPGIDADGVVWVVSHRTGGYELRDASGVVTSQATGQLEALYF
ncbi:MAG TPA: IPT/TIG domain-containing protein, partial [Gammaproteobacteria bacterium]